MKRLVIGRILFAIPVLLVVFSLGFLLMKKTPGGPFDAEKRPPPEVEKNLRKRYHLDDHWTKQYWRELSGYLRFDLGKSLKREQSINEIIRKAFPVSATIGLIALLFAVAVGVSLGVLAASRQNSWFDHGAMFIAIMAISTPSFVLGPLLVLVASMWLGWLPAARLDGASSYILPALALGLIYAASIARLARASVLDVIRQDYIRTARAKGLSEGKVIWKHAVRAGLQPVVTYLGPATASIMTGGFVVETIFQLPGLGTYLVTAAKDSDATMVTALMVFYASLLMMMNLLVDIAYGWIDPRVRDARS
ncbi:MAG: ABC transporter permease [Deltaproteobacteria bacterium]|nr:ABC transporter permease [Deltaproteobacteria bacterium]